MADCTSDPTSGCDNSQLISTISDCCSTQGAKLDTINSKLDDIIAANAACCTAIQGKQDEMIALLTIIANK